MTKARLSAGPTRLTRERGEQRGGESTPSCPCHSHGAERLPGAARESVLSRAPTGRRHAVLDGQLEGLGGPQHHLLTVGAARCPLCSTRDCRWVTDGTVLAVLSLSLSLSLH